MKKYKVTVLGTLTEQTRISEINCDVIQLEGESIVFKKKMMTSPKETWYMIVFIVPQNCSIVELLTIDIL